MKIKKYFNKLLSILPVAAMFLGMTASADLGVLSSGTMSLISDVSSFAQKVIAGAGVIATVYCFIRKAMADDVDQKKWQSRIITSVIATVGGLIAATIINAIGGYYGAASVS